jgi:hypothetical protein
MEWAAGFIWNQWQAWSGIMGPVPPENQIGLNSLTFSSRC